MAIITNLLVSAELGNVIAKLLDLLYQNIGNFGWTVVVFTILLKLILSPLDVWQRLSSRKQQKKMEALRPKLEKIEKQYKNNPDMLRQKQYEAQREAHINIFSSCLPLIVTMVIFFVVFGGFRALVTYENELIVEDLDKQYVSYILDYNYENKILVDSSLSQDEKDFIAANRDNWDEMKNFCDSHYPGENMGFIEYDELKATDPDAFVELESILENEYDKQLEKTSWLWIKNVFKPDTGTSIIPDKKTFDSSGTGGIGGNSDNLNIHTSYTNLVQPALNKYSKSGTWDFKNWNGYFILPLLSLVTSFLYTALTQKLSPAQQSMGTKEQVEQQQKTMKMMNYIMPIMLAIFAVMYSAAFAIYYFMSNILSTLLTIVVTLITKQIDKKEEKNKGFNIRG